MHHPICPTAMWCSTFVKDKCFLHSNSARPSAHSPVFSCGLPVTLFSCSISPWSIGVLLIPGTEEIPLPVIATQGWLICIRIPNKQQPTSVSYYPQQGGSTRCLMARWAQGFLSSRPFKDTVSRLRAINDLENPSNMICVQDPWQKKVQSEWRSEVRQDLPGKSHGSHL